MSSKAAWVCGVAAWVCEVVAWVDLQIVSFVICY